MADVILQVTVPEVQVTRAITAFTKITDTYITIEARKSSPDPTQDFNTRWDFRINPQQVGETTKQFGQRVLIELGKAVINLVDKAEDETRYRTQVAAIVPPTSDVPDNILQ